MESATNSWGDSNMMAWTERMLEIRQAAIAHQLAETAAAASAEVFAERSSPAVQCDLTDSLQSLTDEVLALRREQARLQQAIFEAAQVQRMLCAPRELTWGEFKSPVKSSRSVTFRATFSRWWNSAPLSDWPSVTLPARG